MTVQDNLKYLGPTGTNNPTPPIKPNLHYHITDCLLPDILPIDTNEPIIHTLPHHTVQTTSSNSLLLTLDTWLQDLST